MTKKLSELDSHSPQVMGILNVTPDSFSDGGRYFNNNKVVAEQCAEQALQMIEQGASIIDVGGESTRPGAAIVSPNEEYDRVVPVLDILQGFDCVISLDTSNPLLMSQAKRFGVGLINDVRALQREGALSAAAQSELPVCLMHMLGDPQTMQVSPNYDDVIADVNRFFAARIDACVAAGISRERLLLDPGFGFGKTLQHNKRLLCHLDKFLTFDLPLLVGVSRKSMIGAMLNGRETHDRIYGGLALAVMAVDRGAWIVRTHDVKATSDALTVVYEINRSKDE